MSSHSPPYDTAGLYRVRRESFLGFFSNALSRFWLMRADYVGRGVRVRGHVSISNGGGLFIGNDVVFQAGSSRIALDARRGGILEIGDGARVGAGANLVAHSRISIGRRVVIGQSVSICDKNEASDTPRDIIVEDDVVIGEGAVLLPGVRIGRDSVIQAGSIVTDNVLRHTLVEGDPAHLVRMISRAHRNSRM